MTFTLRVPSSAHPQLRTKAEIISSHLSIDAARAALSKYRAAAEREGHACDAFVWDEDNDRVAKT